MFPFFLKYFEISTFWRYLYVCIFVCLWLKVFSPASFLWHDPYDTSQGIWLQLPVRPLQFNYLSCELFLEKKSCQTPKKKEKKVIFGVLWTKVVLKFSVRLQKKKVQVLRIFFLSVIQSTTGSYHCCSRASDLRRYTSHPLGYRD